MIMDNVRYTHSTMHHYENPYIVERLDTANNEDNFKEKERNPFSYGR